ncbi:YciI family protein [Bacillus sp. Marseille-P3661]|uniref:YciI family protein n=1 Tax=Bacillus sp. Marseille-P3661 TaxID=1936234 RepID=UPI000C82DA7C|nr:YciI family protein [Bacillus sp. Marseille-P3661]
MKHFAVISRMLNIEINKQYREEHLEYLKELAAQGKVLAKGRFTDGTGGLVIYLGESLKEVTALVENDPFIAHGARSYEIHEWEMKMLR